MGPLGGLSREAAHFAIGIDGKAWPKHSPEAVYLTIQAWRDAGEVSGPKDGATRYIREYMEDDKNVPHQRVIDWYDVGKRRNETDGGD